MKLRYLIANGLLAFALAAAMVKGNTLNVTNYGAWPDAEAGFVTTTAGSHNVTMPRTLTSADINKTIEIFGVGDQSTASNNCDLIEIITNVSGTTAKCMAVSNYVSGAFTWHTGTPMLTLPLLTPASTGTYDGSGHFAIGPLQPVWNYTWTPGAHDIQILDPQGFPVGTNASGVFFTVFTNLILQGTPNTSVTATVIPQSQAYCIWGTNNFIPIKNCLAAAGTNTTIYFPKGTVTTPGRTNAYLFIPYQNYTNFIYSYIPYEVNDTCITITQGGLTLLGDGQGQTILMSQGAFKCLPHPGNPNVCMRSEMIGVVGPVTTPLYDFIITNLTIDGGVQVGVVGYDGAQPADPATGLGWDSTHEGINIAAYNAGPMCTNIVIANVTIQHGRGEMAIGTPNEADYVTYNGVTFFDGNVDGENAECGHLETNCLFDTLYQEEEYYEGNPGGVKASLITGCRSTNILHAGFALNGGYTGGPGFVISNNIFSWNFNGSGIGVGNFPNVMVCSNYFTSYGGSCGPIGLGNTYIYQQAVLTPTNNANEWVINNVFTGPFNGYFGGGSPSQSNNPSDYACSLTDSIFSNNVINPSGFYVGLASFAWNSNVIFTANNCYGAKLGVNTDTVGGPYALIGTNNNYFDWILENGGNQFFGYDRGSCFALVIGAGGEAAGITNMLQVYNSNQIPATAYIVLTNATGIFGTPTTVRVHLNGTNFYNAADSYIDIPAGGLQLLSWSTKTWNWQVPSSPASGSPATGGPGGAGFVKTHAPPVNRWYTNDNLVIETTSNYEQKIFIYSHLVWTTNFTNWQTSTVSAEYDPPWQRNQYFKTPVR